AVELLEDYLGRPVELAERTEAMRPDRDGWLWPKATPITDAGDYDIEGYGLVGSHWGGGSIIDPAITVEVTYTGGWTDETLPACIARDLAFAAWRLANPTLPTADVAANATSVRLGDAAITFQGGAGGVAH